MDTMYDDYVADARTHECDDECMEAWLADLPDPETRAREQHALNMWMRANGLDN